MKRNLIYILLSSFVLSFTACNDLLEEKPFGDSTEAEMLSNPDNLIYIVGQAYSDLKWLHDHWGYWGINTLTSDECVCPVRMPGSHWNDGGYWSGMNNHRWTPSSKAFENVWQQSASGTVLCNKLISMLERNIAIIPEDKYAQYRGELEVLRSYYYYTLFDSFGRIPYKEDFVAGDVPQLPVAETWRKLVDCLERNANNLPVVNNANRATQYGRVTQGFAYALLARLYLNAESYGIPNTGENFYSKCIDACQKVIASGSYITEPNFFTNFKIQNEVSRENIFVIVEAGDPNEIPVVYNRSMSNKLRISTLTLHYCHQTAWNMIEKPWNGFCAPAEFISLYEGNDVRGTGTEGNGTKNAGTYGWFIGPIYDATGSKILKDENGTEAIIEKEVNSLIESTWNAGSRMIKYEVDKEKKYAWNENDFVLFRYADVLYMQAEAFLRGGSSSTGASLVSLLSNSDFRNIRTRAGVSPYTEATLTLNELLNERGREFAWENVRRRDLIRFGKFADGSWSGWGSWRGVKSGQYLNWFPIPLPVLLSSNRDENGNPIWTQNPGYPQ